MLTLNPVPFDPMAIIEEVCGVFRHQADMKRVSMARRALPFLALPGEDSGALGQSDENP